MSSPNPTSASSAPAAAAANPDDLKENLWQQMLSKATNTASSQDSTLVVLGDKRCGKSKMLLKFKERSINDKSQDYLFDYSYTHVKNIRDDDPEETVAYMDIWEINSEEHAGNVLPVLLKTHGLRHACYVIALDLSQPWNIMNSLNKWIAVLTKAHEVAMGALTPAQQEEMKLAISSYNQFFVDYSIRAEEAKAAAPKVTPSDDLKLSVVADIPKINLGVPFIVVGCKADTLTQVFTQQVGVGDRFEYMTRHLRKLCFDYGASLVFTSSVGQAGTGIDMLQEYIYHRIYKFELVHPAKPVGSESDFGIRVWSGSDSMDLINSIQPAKAAWGDNAPFQEVFKDPTQAKVAAAMKHDPEIKTEDNDIFFKKLKFDMEKGTARVRTRINVNPNAIAEAANPVERAPSDKVASAIPLPTPAPAPAPAATAAASTAAAAAASSKTPMKNDQRAVKDFFRSLLTSSAPGGGAAKPTQASVKDALEQLKADK